MEVMEKVLVTGRPTVRHRVPELAGGVLSPRTPADPEVVGIWRWLFADEAGVAVTGPRIRFTSENAAETWLLGNADQLRHLHIAAVTLFAGPRVVNGPTGLLPGSPSAAESSKDADSAGTG